MVVFIGTTNQQIREENIKSPEEKKTENLIKKMMEHENPKKAEERRKTGTRIKI